MGGIEGTEELIFPKEIGNPGNKGPILLIKGFARASCEQGFTLSELMGAVAIIAVLVAVSIPLFFGQLERSRESADSERIHAQHAEVMTEALYLNSSLKYSDIGLEKIPLKQTRDNWQSTSLEKQLKLSFSTVKGIPTAGGYAWVEYEKGSGMILYFDGSGDNTAENIPVSNKDDNASESTEAATNSSEADNAGSATEPSTDNNMNVPAEDDNGGKEDISVSDGGLIDADGRIIDWDKLTDKDDGILILSDLYKQTQTVQGVVKGKKLSGKLVIREGLTDIHNFSLNNQRDLKSVVFPNSMRVISNYAFDGSGLVNVEIHDGIRSINKSAFSNLKNLEGIEWHYNPDNEYEIGGRIFSGSGVNGQKIKIKFHGTEEQWSSILDKNILGLDEERYELEILP